jgi:rod shape-determining protein MreB and related proteins
MSQELTAGRLEFFVGPVSNTVFLHMPTWLSWWAPKKYNDLAVDLGTSKGSIADATHQFFAQAEILDDEYDSDAEKKIEKVFHIPAWVTRVPIIRPEDQKGTNDSALDYKDDRDRIIHVGIDAWEMLSMVEPEYESRRAAEGGNIADRRAYRAMLRHLFEIAYPETFKGRFKGWRRPRIVIGVPHTADIHHIEMIKSVIKELGGKPIVVLEQVAAAFGAGLAPNVAGATLFADIGAGTIDCVVITFDQDRKSVHRIMPISYKTAGDALDDAIIRYMYKTHGLTIDSRTATIIKETIGSAIAPDMNDEEDKVEFASMPADMFVWGSRSQQPSRVQVTAAEIRECMQKALQEMVRDLCRYMALHNSNARVHAEIMKKGIVISGGGACLRGIRKYLQAELRKAMLLLNTEDSKNEDKVAAAIKDGIRVAKAQNPRDAVLLGIQKMLTNKQYLELARAATRGTMLKDIPFTPSDQEPPVQGKAA